MLTDTRTNEQFITKIIYNLNTLTDINAHAYTQTHRDTHSNTLINLEVGCGLLKITIKSNYKNNYNYYNIFDSKYSRNTSNYNQKRNINYSNN